MISLFFDQLFKIIKRFSEDSPTILSKFSLEISRDSTEIIVWILRPEHLEILSTENSYYILGRNIVDISEDSLKNHKGDLEKTYREYSLNSLERFSRFSCKDLFRELADISTEKSKRILPGLHTFAPIFCKYLSWESRHLENSAVEKTIRYHCEFNQISIEILK